MSSPPLVSLPFEDGTPYVQFAAVGSSAPYVLAAARRFRDIDCSGLVVHLGFPAEPHPPRWTGMSLKLRPYVAALVSGAGMTAVRLPAERWRTFHVSLSSVAPPMPMSSLCSSMAAASLLSLRKRKFVGHDIADNVVDEW